MKRLVLATSFALAASPLLADDSQRWFESPSRLTQETGEGIYNAVCASCHMPDGQGATGAGTYPALAGNDRLEFPDYAIFLVLKGQAGMPAIGGILNDDQVAEVVNYIRGAWGNFYAEPAATAEMVAAQR